MSRELRFDINDGYPEFNLQNPLLKNLRACKKIAPKQGSVEIGGEIFSSGHPRIVRTDFKTPPNWIEIEIIENGKELAPGQFHTCSKSKSDNSTVNGYWVKIKKVPIW